MISYEVKYRPGDRKYGITKLSHTIAIANEKAIAIKIAKALELYDRSGKLIEEIERNNYE